MTEWAPDRGVTASPFPPIAEYGFLSDCETCALVAPNGNVEWLCLPRFDSPSVFGAILDRDAFAGREAVRDERRLERDHGGTLGERLAHLVREADHAGRSMVMNSCSPNFSNVRTCRSPTSWKPSRSYSAIARAFHEAT